MDEWQPDAIKVVKEDDGSSARLYLWIIPAQAEGQWTWSIGETTYALDVSQDYQEVSIQLHDGRNTFETDRATLQGNRLAFSAHLDGVNHVYSGHIQENRISGLVQIREGTQQRIERWEASKE